MSKKTLEKKIERDACRTAEAHGWYQRKFTSPGHRGVPDRLFIKGNRVVLIEFKCPGESLDPLQCEEFDALYAVGFEDHWVANSVQRVREILKIAAECEHEWVDARNKAVKSGELCIKCNAIRAGNVI